MSELDKGYRIQRTARWILFFPMMYAAALLSGFVIANEALMLLLPAIIGILIAPGHRIFVTFIAYLLGNYLYRDYLKAMSYQSMPDSLWEILKYQLPAFLWPTIVTLISAVAMDIFSKKIKSKRLNSIDQGLRAGI